MLCELALCPTCLSFPSPPTLKRNLCVCVCQVGLAVAGPGQRGPESLRCAGGGPTHLHPVCPLPQGPVRARHCAHTQVLEAGCGSNM